MTPWAERGRHVVFPGLLETIIMGHMIRIDPFDQPAVEPCKILARAYLETM
jgi:glucose-6-phosphate isomerase